MHDALSPSPLLCILHLLFPLYSSMGWDPSPELQFELVHVSKKGGDYEICFIVCRGMRAFVYGACKVCKEVLHPTQMVECMMCLIYATARCFSCTICKKCVHTTLHALNQPIYLLEYQRRSQCITKKIGKFGAILINPVVPIECSNRFRKLTKIRCMLSRIIGEYLPPCSFTPNRVYYRGMMVIVGRARGRVDKHSVTS